eukprot:NODE_7_length_67686_cov_1.621421.p12 type:complete len:382 gc:universal NODE_7_length_67686_cov_1.621421:19994-18849(-)
MINFVSEMRLSIFVQRIAICVSISTSNKMSAIWLPIAFGIVFCISLSALIYNIQNIVIHNRKPYLVITEQISTLIWVIMLVLTIPCLFSQIFTTVTVYFVYLRVMYTYQTIVPQTQNFSLLHTICNIFWSRNRLNFRCAIFFMILLAILRIAQPLIYSISTGNNILLSSCPEVIELTDSVYTISGSIQTFIVIFLVCIFVTNMLCARNDKIGMKYEMTGFALTSVLIVFSNIVFNTVVHINPIINVALHVFNLNFWGVIFPLIITFRLQMSSRRSLPIFGHLYNYSLLKDVSRQFFCEENILFLSAYDEYTKFPSAELYRDILDKYICKNAEFRVNIDENHRTKAIESPNGLYDVYLEVTLLVKDNLIPYLSQDDLVFDNN